MGFLKPGGRNIPISRGARSRRTLGEQIYIDGMDELLETFQKVADSIDKEEMAQRLLAAGFYIRDRAKANAPIGPTGHLAAGMAIVTEMSPEKKAWPAVIVKPDYRMAPHFHLVEFGARGGQMPANPFFRRSIDESRETVKSMIIQGALEVIEKEAEKS